MLFSPKGEITLRVLEAVKEKLAAAEKTYVNECEKIDREAFQAKMDAADKIVSEIVK